MKNLDIVNNLYKLVLNDIAQMELAMTPIHEAHALWAKNTKPGAICVATGIRPRTLNRYIKSFATGTMPRLLARKFKPILHEGNTYANINTSVVISKHELS